MDKTVVFAGILRLYFYSRQLWRYYVSSAHCLVLFLKTLFFWPNFFPC